MKNLTSFLMTLLVWFGYASIAEAGRRSPCDNVTTTVVKKVDNKTGRTFTVTQGCDDQTGAIYDANWYLETKTPSDSSGYFANDTYQKEILTWSMIAPSDCQAMSNGDPDYRPCMSSFKHWQEIMSYTTNTVGSTMGKTKYFDRYGRLLQGLTFSESFSSPDRLQKDTEKTTFNVSAKIAKGEGALQLPSGSCSVATGRLNYMRTPPVSSATPEIQNGMNMKYLCANYVKPMVDTSFFGGQLFNQDL